MVVLPSTAARSSKPPSDRTLLRQAEKERDDIRDELEVERGVVQSLRAALALSEDARAKAEHMVLLLASGLLAEVSTEQVRHTDHFF